MATSDPLKAYKAKRNFAVTPEPAEGGKANESKRSFVVQKHWATRLHYDFRLELDGTMKSWAVPKGPSLDPRDKRMAVHVEDHPISYNTFEGEIPAQQYGAGRVIIWDKGIWVPVGDPYQGYRNGNLKFELHGHKLQGKWALIRMKGKGGKQEPWLLIKEKDDRARPAEKFSVVDALPDSVTKMESPETHKPSPKISPSRKRREAKSTMPATAIKANLPVTLKPQLATLADRAPDDTDAWQYEIKFDGYRILARIDGKEIRLFTRNGNDWSHKLPALIASLQKLNLAPGWLDGEIVVLNARGIPDFQALQGAFDETRTEDIVYYIFDVPFYDGFDLRAVPLVERKQLLGKILDNAAPAAIRFSATVEASPRDVLDSACRLGLEGVIGKRKMSGYVSRRSADWIKLKCTQRQEFVIGGYTDPQGARAGIGSLLLGVHDDERKLRYAGNVGTGFNAKSLLDVKRKLDSLASSESPFQDKTGIDHKAHWVAPRLLAEVSFGEWTRTGRIRHAVFHGLRSDKKAAAIIREKPLNLRTAAQHDLPVGLKITHPDKMVDPSTQTTKMQVVQYYSLVASLMMEHLKGRPVALLRAPDGITGQLFFQKHIDNANMAGVRQLDLDQDRDHAALLEVAKPEGLLSMAQMNVLEFHTWNALKTNIHKPDRMTFDLDPGEGVSWIAMQESAHILRAFLTQLDLVPFIKTSGGKGLHIVVPLKRLQGWDGVKDFSRAIVQHLAETLPQRFTATSGPRNRAGKIFIDYLRNGFGATTVAAWSLRSRPGLGVSVPIEWPELDTLASSSQWTLANIQSRLELGNTPWKGYSNSAQSLTPAMKTLGFRPSKKNA